LENALNFGEFRFFKAEIRACPAFEPKIYRQPIHIHIKYFLFPFSKSSLQFKQKNVYIATFIEWYCDFFLIF
jgi:hypothetical protein